MPYNPTKEELADMGFEIEIYCEWKSFYGFTKVWQYIEYKGYKQMWKLWMKQFYPESREDIETLIRLFTIPNNP